jgi:hypothetical protein
MTRHDRCPYGKRPDLADPGRLTDHAREQAVIERIRAMQAEGKGSRAIARTHRCVFYKEHQGVRNARLIGHGGVPVYMTHPRDADHKSPSFYEYREFIRTGLEKWAYFGFAVVDFFDRRARVRYIDEFGTTFKEETL